jgi:hypothetical protein
MPGKPTLPVYILQRRDEYITALKEADAAFNAGSGNVPHLGIMIARGPIEQTRSALIGASFSGFIEWVLMQ